MFGRNEARTGGHEMRFKVSSGVEGCAADIVREAMPVTWPGARQLLSAALGAEGPAADLPLAQKVKGSVLPAALTFWMMLSAVWTQRLMMLSLPEQELPYVRSAVFVELLAFEVSGRKVISQAMADTLADIHIAFLEPLEADLEWARTHVAGTFDMRPLPSSIFAVTALCRLYALDSVTTSEWTEQLLMGPCGAQVKGEFMRVLETTMKHAAESVVRRA